MGKEATTLCRQCVDTVAHPAVAGRQRLLAPNPNKPNKFNALQALTHPLAALARWLR